MTSPRYSLDTARDSVDWTKIWYIVRDNVTGATRSFSTKAEALVALGPQYQQNWEPGYPR